MELDNTSSFIRQMPKIEVHAHLSGSISRQTVRELINLHQQNYPNEPIPSNVSNAFRTPEECGTENNAKENELKKASTEEETQVFDAVYDTFFAAQFLIDHLDAVELATRRVLEEFAADNVIYFELRTTPRHVAGKMEQIQHITKVLEVIHAMVSERQIMKGCRLLLSIDRRRSLDVAQETLTLYLQLRDQSPFGYLLGGIDFSGDARSNDAVTFIPILKKAQTDHGIKIAVHLAEIPNEKETCAFVGARPNDSGIAACELYLPLRSACGGRLLPSVLMPDRIGHGTYIHPAISGGSQRMWDLLIDSEIPVEICLTSNVSCKTAKSYAEHHVKYLLAANHPFMICTDDKGAFNTTLSEEWMHLETSHQLSQEEVFKINLESVNYLFIENSKKQDVYNEMVSWYYHYLSEKGIEEDGNKTSKKCKFRVLNQFGDHDDKRTPKASESNVKELCNKIRGQKCVVHSDISV